MFGLGRKRRKPKRGQRIEPRLMPRGGPGKVPTGRRSPKKRRRSLALRLASLAATFGLLGILGAAAITAYVYVNLEKQGLFHIPEREPGIMLLAADGQIVAERGSFFGDAVRLDELPTYLPQAVIAIEDRRFYSHFGIDFVGLARALLANLRAGRVVQGGSTLTQQLAKNLFLEPARTYERKFQEAVLALWLENKFSKDEILQLYLNRVYFGGGAVGVDKAAQSYFGKSARDVSLAEAAILAAVLKAPTTYNPINHPDRAAGRAREVISDMVEVGFISQDVAERAQSVRATVRAADYLPASQYIVDWIAEQLPELIGTFDASIVVETTIDRTLQTLAEKTLQRSLEAEGGKLHVSQGAVVMLDTEGAVKAMVGGKSYIKSQYNRAVKAKRQPGSAFKPFVYLTAIEQGFTPESIEVDEPVKFGDWSPENYRRKYLGPVSLRKAISLSLNTVAAKLAVAVGPANVVTTAHRLGIVSDLQANASIALGTSEVSLLEMTAAFSPFANGGRTVIPHVITRISSRDGRILYQRQGDGFGITVTDYDLGAMNDMLRAVISEGTGRSARLDPHDVAGKTGTSQDYRDAWFIGYSTYYVAGVWVGNDDNSPTVKVTGGTLPAAIWRGIMETAHQSLEPNRLPGDWRQPEVPLAEYQQDNQGGFFGVFQSMFGTGQAPTSESGFKTGGNLTEQQRRQRMNERQKQLLDSR